jgi:hypothetical protein
MHIVLRKILQAVMQVRVTKYLRGGNIREGDIYVCVCWRDIGEWEKFEVSGEGIAKVKRSNKGRGGKGRI